MGRPGRRLFASPAQQAEVLRRVDAGETYRAIALAVFGDDAAKNRITRIVRRRTEDERELEEIRVELARRQVEDQFDVDDEETIALLTVEERARRVERAQSNMALLGRLRELTARLGGRARSPELSRDI